MINNPRIIKNGREHEYEFSFIRKYFDILMEKDVVYISIYTLMIRIFQMNMLWNMIVFIVQSIFYVFIMNDRIDSEYHFCYYIFLGTDEFFQVKLKRSFNCTAFKTWEACFAFLEWSFENKGM